MKILQINNFHLRRGGADIVYLNTINLLKKHGEQVIDFSQISSNNENSQYADSFVDNFDILKFPFYKKLIKTPRQLYSFETKQKLSQLIEKTKPDIAHIHLYKGVLTASILSVLKKYDIPAAITLHDYSLLCPRNILFNAENKICEKCITSTSLNCVIHRCNRKNFFYSTINFIEYNLNNKFFKPERNFDKIIAVSLFSFNKHLLRKNLRNHLVHLYNFSPGLEEIEVNNTKGKYFLYFGRLSIEKGLSTLIEAFGRLDKSYSLKIVGTGPLQAEIKKQVQLNKCSNVEILGYKSGMELNCLIRNSSFVIVPSEWYENNPMTIVEAFSYGKPVIGSRVGGIPELIFEGRTGFGFEMANITDLIKVIQKANGLTKDEYLVMSKNARNFAIENFSEESHYKKLINLYSEMLFSKKNFKYGKEGIV
jgi:glycosyltransferase involved in cell wall biosynthesis